MYYTCMYLCMCIRTYAFMYVCIYYKCKYACMYYKVMHVYTYVCTINVCMYACTYIWLYIRMYVLYMHVCMYVRTRVCRYVYTRQETTLIPIVEYLGSHHISSYLDIHSFLEELHQEKKQLPFYVVIITRESINVNQGRCQGKKIETSTELSENTY